MKKTVEQLNKYFTDGISVAQCAICGKSGDVCNGCAYLVSAGILAYKLLSIFLDQTKDDCPECGGSGKDTFVSTMDLSTYEGACLNCRGTGKVGEWHPERLVMLDEDQTLPAIPFNYEDECREYTSYSKARQDMLRESWRKVIVRE